MGDPCVDMLGLVWGSISELCDDLTEQEWSLATDCPGWTVQDQLSHIVGPEAAFLGRPQPTGGTIKRPYIRNPIGSANEALVDYRRAWSGSQVLAEFRDVTSERLAALQAMDEEDLDEESWTPAGPGKYRDLLAIRVLDAWVHEQDIRAALRRPGHLEGPVPRHVLGRCFLAMPYVVGKKAAAPEGSTVVFLISGPTAGSLAIEVTDGRARAVEQEPAMPSVTLEADFVTFTRVANGRAEALGALEEGTITVRGEAVLGRTIVEKLNFMI
jgi:uncharacterized protein (TIGR03083 family)